MTSFESLEEPGACMTSFFILHLFSCVASFFILHSFRCMTSFFIHADAWLHSCMPKVSAVRYCCHTHARSSLSKYLAKSLALVAHFLRRPKRKAVWNLRGNCFSKNDISFFSTPFLSFSILRMTRAWRRALSSGKERGCDWCVFSAVPRNPTWPVVYVIILIAGVNSDSEFMHDFWGWGWGWGGGWTAFLVE